MRDPTERKPSVAGRADAMADFSRYRPMDEAAVRKSDVAENKMLRWIKDAWKSLVFDEQNVKDCYEKSLAAVGRLCYSADDVELFSIMLAEFQDEQHFGEKAGLFLSALINSGKDSNYTIHTAHLSVSIEYIGFMNIKSITVKGSAGDWCGDEMEKCSIIVEGNASSECGYGMKGGSITVKGSAGDWCGDEMGGGLIIVEGDVGERCGVGMQGGSISVNGNAGVKCGWLMENGSITVRGDVGVKCGAEMKGGLISVDGEMQSIADSIEYGRIYHKGKLIFDQ